jgi:DNA-binding transcriptional ArsR family regulator
MRLRRSSIVKSRNTCYDFVSKALWREADIVVSDATIFTALADPTRRQLLTYLAENSPRTATQLAADYPITRQGILKHLTILEDAGLVAVHQCGREKRYTLTPEPLDELEQWIKDIGAKWDQRLVRLKAFVEQNQVDE